MEKGDEELSSDFFLKRITESRRRGGERENEVKLRIGAAITIIIVIDFVIDF